MDYIQINERDNVCVALSDISRGTVIDTGSHKVTVLSEVSRGHKIALTDIKAGEDVIKYGSPIGHAEVDIRQGEHVHIHNLKTNLSDLISYEYQPEKACTPSELTFEGASFEGFERTDGKVGIRNEIWIIPTVGCVNSVASQMAEVNKDLISGTLSDIIAFPHPYGCSQMGGDQEYSRKALADLINHPNAGGVLVLGLGCENSNIGVLKPYIGAYDEKRVRFLQCQDVEDEQAEGRRILSELAEYVKTFKRTACPVSKLIVGLKCGGSDGLSGITANPVVGMFSDALINRGGTTILTEVPEMFGAETLLMDRCVNRSVFDKTVALINDFKEYYRKHDQVIYENPSPGNKAGGISTLEDKSLGCTQKSGSAKVSDVLEYAEPVSVTGLNLLSAPGNDLVAATGLSLSGAQLVLFTTGRGTPFAAPVPTLKISTNSPLAAKKDKWIDFNTGTLTDGADRKQVAAELYSLVLEVASGRQVKAEQAGFHDMAIFKQGVTL